MWKGPPAGGPFLLRLERTTDPRATMYRFEQVWVPSTMTESFSNAEFV
jgi:hypothetical protein